MATQGLITITERGKVRAKIITGCDGKRVIEIANYLRKHPTTIGWELLALAKRHDLGGPSLIIQTGPDEWLADDEIEELGPLYAEKFDVPDFNPRWHYGTAEYTERVELHSENDGDLATQPAPHDSDNI